MKNTTKAILAGAAIGALAVVAVGTYILSKCVTVAEVCLFDTEDQNERKVDELLPDYQQKESEDAQ